MNDYRPQRLLGSRRSNNFWKAVVTSFLSLCVFFGLLEALLFLSGVEPGLRSRDPFVGFVSNVPLFVEETDPDGRKILTTSKNKLTFFNYQKFPLEKAAGTYRIFCLGGSTTYGRPYNDRTSFAGWLRALLPVADPQRHWEVINAGGISYASYRVANLMEELVRYKPDLFIVYSGHNEFLEERTYGDLRNVSSVIKSTATLLAHTRTWTAMTWLLNRLGALSGTRQDGRAILPGEVNTILARSAGPERYKRDDALQDRILQHYRISLERMVDIARFAGTDVLFVTPASNLKDSPFKSQHTAGLSPEKQLQSEELLSAALKLIQESAWKEALKVMDEALAMDPRFSELHYRRGKILFAIGKYEEAGTALRRARDEDVCPLRALSPMRKTITDVAIDKNVTLVDFIDLLENQMRKERGHPIPGQEYFLDHVHPTIAGNRMLAVALVQSMIEKGIVRPADSWGERAIADVASWIEGGLDRKMQAQALVNLAKVLNWAGKAEDAARLAGQVLASGVEDPEFISSAASILASVSNKQGDTTKTLQYLRRALSATPSSPNIHLQIGLTHINRPLRDFEVGAAHILRASVFMPEDDLTHLTFGLAMAERRRYAVAYPSVLEALRLNPRNTDAESSLVRLRKLLKPKERIQTSPKVSLTKYPSGTLHKIVQVIPNPTGRYIPNGLLTEWFENGQLKRLLDYTNGRPNGVEITWDPSGRVISRAEYRHGTRLMTSGGK